MNYHIRKIVYFCLAAGICLTFRHVTSEDVNVCEKQSGNFSRMDDTNELTLRLVNNNCSSKDNAVLLKLNKMDVVGDKGHCGATVEIKLDSRTPDFCRLRAGDCLLIAPHGESYTNATRDCKWLSVQVVKAIFPLEMESKFRHKIKKGQAEPDAKFEIQFVVVSIEAWRAGGTGESAQTIFPTTSSISSITTQPNTRGVERVLAIFFGVLFALSLAVFTAVLYRMMRKLRATGAQAEVLESDHPDVVYSVVNKRQRTNARSEREVIVNELYNI